MRLHIPLCAALLLFPLGCAHTETTRTMRARQDLPASEGPVKTTDGENGATYEVEVTRPDGATVDVRLDGDFRTVVVEGDTE